MNRIDRLTAMILMLQSERVVTAEQIAEHFEISVRTVYRDLAALGEAGVPIIAEAGVGYSLMRGYHIPAIMFTEEEAVGLFMSGELTEKFGDDSLKKAVRSAMLKVRAVLPTERKDYLGRLGDVVSVQDPPNKPATEGALMTVQEAVVRHRCLELDYDTAGRGEISTRVVEPLGVVYYGHKWHLIAWCRLREGLRDFRLDRMRRWEVLGETFNARDDFSLMEFLRFEADPEELSLIVIECENWALDRVLEDLPAQLVERSELPDGRVKIEAMAYCLDWTMRWLLGLGKAAVVRSPDELRDKVATAAHDLASHHKFSPPSEAS